MISLLLGMSLAKPGVLILAGGGETSPQMVQRFFQAIGGPDRKIIVLGQTREEPPNARSSVELLTENGATNVVLIDDTSFDRKKLSAYAKEWADARGFWIPGGDQNFFMDRFGVRWARWYFPKRLREGVSFFGTSAGAMIASHTMIAGNGDDGQVLTAPGIGLTKILIDTHYRERNRQARMRQALARTGAPMAIGIERSEFIVLENDQLIEQVGSADVVRP